MNKLGENIYFKFVESEIKFTKINLIKSSGGYYSHEIFKNIDCKLKIMANFYKHPVTEICVFHWAFALKIDSIKTPLNE